MIDSLSEVRAWAKGLLTDLDNSPSDTFHVRINENRKRWQPRFSSIARVNSIKNRQPLLPDTTEVVTLFQELYHYFDTGYQAPHGIDDLPGLCKEALSNLIADLDILEVQTRGVR